MNTKNKGFTFYGLAIGTVLFGVIYAVIITLFMGTYSYFWKGVFPSGETLMFVAVFSFVLALIAMLIIHFIMKNNPGR